MSCVHGGSYVNVGSNTVRISLTNGQSIYAHSNKCIDALLSSEETFLKFIVEKPVLPVAEKGGVEEGAEVEKAAVPSKGKEDVKHEVEESESAIHIE